MKTLYPYSSSSVESLLFTLFFIHSSTVNENIIGAPQNKKLFLVLYKNSNFSNIAIAIFDFSLLLTFSYHSSNFAIAKVVPLCFIFCIDFVDWFMASHIVIALPTIEIAIVVALLCP